MSAKMRKIVISGGPSTGKTTIFEMLNNTFPDAYFVNEAAETVIKRETAKQKEDPSYTPIMPVSNYREFVPLVMAQQITNEEAIPNDADLVIMDRSIIDNLGYLAHYGLSEYENEVHRRIRTCGYTLAFFCDWLGKVEQNDIRQETYEEGLAIHRHLETAYHESGMPVVHLPAVSVAERLTIITNTIKSL